MKSADNFRFLRVLVLERAPRYWCVYPLRQNQGPVPVLHYCFLVVPPLSLHPLPPLLVVVQSASPVRPFVTPWTAACVFPVLHHLPVFTQTHVHWIGNTIQPSHPLHTLLLLPSIFPSIRGFSNELALRARWSKSWSFSFRINPSNEYSGLIPWLATVWKVSVPRSPTGSCSVSIPVPICTNYHVLNRQNRHLFVLQ